MTEVAEPAPSAAPMVYEVPLNERTRLFLRLEFLFAQAAHHLKQPSPWDRRQYLVALLDVLQLLSRSDVRTEVSKELADHIAKLENLLNDPRVDGQRLTNVLDAARKLEQALGPVQAQFAGNLLRDSEFLTGIMNRVGVPGGTAPFDMPAYHHWLHRDAAFQEAQIQNWSRYLELFERCIAFALRLNRQSGDPKDVVATSGNFSLQLVRPYHLARIFLPADSWLYPEISAGRHRVAVRFMQLQEGDLKPVATTRDVPFQLTLCGL